MKTIPQFLKKYFWDVNFTDFDSKKYEVFVIKRILEYGNTKAVRWLFKNFKEEKIKNVLLKRRGFSFKTINFWVSFFDLDPKKVLCLSKSYQKLQETHWPY